MTGPARGAPAHDLPEHVEPTPPTAAPSPINAALAELRRLGLDGTADRIEELPASDRAAYCRMRADRLWRGAEVLARLEALLTPDDGSEL